MTYVRIFFDPTSSAMAYCQRPKFVRAKHLTMAEGETCAYGPTLLWLDQLKIIGTSSKWKFMKETRRINMKQKEIDQDIVIEMFDHLKESSSRKSKCITK